MSYGKAWKAPINLTYVTSVDTIKIQCEYNFGFNRSLMSLFEVPDEVFWNPDTRTWDVVGIDNLNIVEDLLQFYFPNGYVKYKETKEIAEKPSNTKGMAEAI